MRKQQTVSLGVLMVKQSICRLIITDSVYAQNKENSQLNTFSFFAYMYKIVLLYMTNEKDT